MADEERAPRARGARIMVLMLPNGRSVWLSTDPEPVTVREFDQVTAWVNRAIESRCRATRSNAAATRDLKRMMRKSSARLNRFTLGESSRLTSLLEEGDAKVAGRIERDLRPVLREARGLQRRHLAITGRYWRRVGFDQLILVSGLVLMAAYGRRGSPLVEDNLVIGLSPVLWLFGDQMSEWLAGNKDRRSYWIRSTDLWSYIAPFANLLAGWWLLGDRQHERFITGATHLDVGPRDKENVFAVVSEVDNYGLERHQRDTYWTAVDLSSLVAPDLLPDFVGFTNVPAFATLQSVEFNPDVRVIKPRMEIVLAEIRREFLLISVRVKATVRKGTPKFDPPPLLKRLNVAWAVDTGSPKSIV